MINQNIIVEYGLTESWDQFHPVEIALMGQGVTSDLLKMLNALDHLDEATLRVLYTYLELRLSNEKA